MQQRKIIQGYLILVLFVVGFVAYVNLTFNNTEKDFYQWDEIIKLNDHWIFEAESGEQSIISLPIRETTKAQTTYRLTNQLPESWKEGSVICFKSDHLLVHVFIDGNEVYSLQVDERSTIGKSPGFAYVFIPLTSNMFGKQIIVEYTAVYSRSSFHINEFVLGEKSTIITGLLRENALALFICGFCICLGIIFIITYFIKHKTYEMSKSLLYLGIFAIPLSIWSMTETQTMQFFIRNMYSLQYVTYLALALCPIPFLLYYAQRHKLQESWPVKVISRICMAVPLICLSLQAFGMVDLPDTLVLIHGCVALVLIYSFYHSVREFLRGSYTKLSISFSAVSMVILLLCTVLDLFRFYLTANDDYSKYVRIGFVFYLGCTGLGTIFRSAQIDKTNKELEQLAYMDYETGVLNRTSFIKYVEGNQTPRLAFVAIEVLELKDIKNSFGTIGKSEVVKSAAKIIERAFMNYGKIFRITEAGFVIVLENEIDKAYHHGMEVLKKRVHNSNKSRGYKLHLGDSYTLYDKQGNKEVEMVLEELEYSLKEPRNKEFT